MKRLSFFSFILSSPRKPPRWISGWMNLPAGRQGKNLARKTIPRTLVRGGVIFLMIFSAMVVGYVKLYVKNEYAKPLFASQGTFWKYQCIDTMKTSRDKARAWAKDTNVSGLIEKEMLAIKSMGGNCVAIATPYDEEFLPYLQLWVQKAREQNLAVWFRGNFSSWEGWFDYPKGMTTAQHTAKTQAFIANNPDLFQNGDLFTPAPEAENGGPFNQVETDEYEVFRKYLIDEYTSAKDAFAKINKTVEVRWLSMNGGLAKRMLDKETIDAIGGVVSIDHYVRTEEEMSEFITYFHDQFGARVSIGEFGAPIPDINGSMTQAQQAEFMEQLFFEIYKHTDIVDGISYWVLYDGSTALLNPNYSERPVVAVVRKYFQPGMVSGTTLDIFQSPVSNVTITASDNVGKAVTDKSGAFALLLPDGQYTLAFAAPNYKPVTKEVAVDKGSQQEMQIEIEHAKPTKLDNLRLFLKNLLEHVGVPEAIEKHVKNDIKIALNKLKTTYKKLIFERYPTFFERKVVFNISSGVNK